MCMACVPDCPDCKYGWNYVIDGNGYIELDDHSRPKTYWAVKAMCSKCLAETDDAHLAPRKVL